MPPWVIGIDLGGTKTEIGLVSPENEIAARRRFATEDWRGPQSLVERIDATIGALQAEISLGADLAAVGICAPGPLDHITGMLLEPVNIPGLHHMPLQAMLEAQLHAPVRVEHDAKAAGLGEYYFGAGLGERSMVYIIIGTGVGAAIIMNGRLYHGLRGAAGEFGHATIDLHGVQCHCGSIGCAETFLSGPWLARRYAAARQGIAPSWDMETGITGAQVNELAAAGDPLAEAVIAQAGEALGAMVGAQAMTLDIECFVVGGSVAHCGDSLFIPARAAVKRYAFDALARRVRILPNALDTDAPILGCAWLARRALGA
ncbi:MAG: ROK family protein [Caldilineaceae bacterium]|nr:ROK family protein [Caldilineaceae bacterium]